MLGGAGLFQLLEWVAVYRAQSQVRENHSPQLLIVWGPKGWLESITVTPSQHSPCSETL